MGEKADSHCVKPHAPPEIEARALFNGEREVSIRYRDQIYRLRITRNDKLILTK